mmetsp:Transcript_40820/g.79931  ORF Transcript_40820/g.79931 Transcript_40820/m.79931 type:complete len:249 (-) Transcript_40820:580-1326(-)
MKISSTKSSRSGKALDLGWVLVFLEDLVNVRLHLLCPLQPKRPNVLLELGDARGSDDGRGDEGARVAEGDGKLGGRHAVLACEFRVDVDSLSGERVLVACHIPREQVEAPLCRLLLRHILGVLSAQHASRERAVGQQANVCVLRQAHLLQPRLVVHPVDEGVTVLDGDNLWEIKPLCSLAELHNAKGGLVGDAHVADLSLLLKLLELRELLLERLIIPHESLVELHLAEERHVSVGPVNLDKIDVVSA